MHTHTNKFPTLQCTIISAYRSYVQVAAFKKFQSRVAETVAERKTVVDRHMRSAEIEARRLAGELW